MNLPIHEAVAAALRPSGLNHVAVHRAAECERCHKLLPLRYSWPLKLWLCNSCAKENVSEVIEHE